ncbi:MAG TPA: hypothetical protein VK654_00510 [Nitrospirota bacterium]|nr:hypothetical protein [Nitrospirota bacterium]
MTTKQSFKERIEMKKNAMLASGLVSERMPGVSSIICRMTYHQRTAGPVLMTRIMNFSPRDYACFHLDCLREECTDGGFDLTPIVRSLVRNRKKSGKGRILCRGKSSSLRQGHASISYEVDVEYDKAGKRARKVAV